MTRFNLSPSDIANGATQAVAPIEAAATHAAAGMEQGALAALHAAAQPISPLIQMIMRMPGHIGLMSSVFEAFGSFFFSHVQFLAHLDPSILNLHAHVSEIMSHARLPGAEHMGIDHSLLPGDAPILQAHGAGSEHLFGQFARHDILKDAVALRDQLKVSGQMDLGRPQFETGHGLSTQVGGLSGKGEALSGPMMRDVPTANHMAGSQRLFSDQLSLSKTTPMSTSSVAATPQPVPSSMNVGGNSLGQQAEAAPAVGQMSDTAPAAAGSQNVSGGGLGEASHASTESSTTASTTGADMGGKQLIADKGTMNFRPTVGSTDVGTGYDASYLQNQASTAAHSTSAQTHALGGLKAQQLSLNGDIKPAPHAVSAQPTHLKPEAGSTADHVNRHAYHHSSDVQIHHRGLGAHSFAKDMISHRNLPGVQYDPSRHASSAAPTPAHAPVEAHAAPSQTQAPVGEQAGQAQPAAENQAQAAPDGQEIAQTPATTNGAGAETAAPSTYTIRAGDCLWNIAKDHLHSATRWSEIYKMNTDVIGGNPSLIHPGTQINLPGHGSEVASTGTGLENGEYIVKSGDNLWNISKHFTGDGSKWGELYKANADVIGANPDLILPGQHLHVPGAETSTVAEAPAAATQQVASAGPDPTQATTADASQAAPPTSLEAAAAPPPTQSYAPADLHQAGAASQLSQAATPAPVTVAPAAVTPQAVAPTAAIAPATPHLGGPGAAAAGELHLPPIAELAQTVPPKSVVSSSLAPDLAQFMRRAK